MEKNLEMERQKYKMTKEGIGSVSTSIDDFSKKMEKIILKTKYASMYDVEQLTSLFLDSIKSLKSDVDEKNNEVNTLSVKNKDELSKSIKSLNTKFDETLSKQHSNLLQNVSNSIDTLRKEIPVVPELTDIYSKLDILYSKLNEFGKTGGELRRIEGEVKSNLLSIKNEIPKLDTGEELIAKIQAVKKQWLSIEAIDGDFNTKVTKQFGGGNTRPLDLLVNGVSYGGVREINFKGGGVSADIVSGVMTVTIAGGGSTAIDNEVLTGSGTAFSLANSPVVGSVKVYGLGQRLILSTDYSISSNNITTVSSWSAGEIISDYLI